MSNRFVRTFRVVVLEGSQTPSEVYRVAEEASRGIAVHGGGTVTLDGFVIRGRVPGPVLEHLRRADVVIMRASAGSVDRGSVELSVALGWALGMAKSVVLLDDRRGSPCIDKRIVHMVAAGTPDEVRAAAGKLQVFLQACQGCSDVGSPLAESPDRVSVFLSYSHSDKSFLKRAMLHFQASAVRERIDAWCDNRLKPGDEWITEIRCAIERASAAVLFVSADFYSSRFIATKELPRLLEKAELDGLRVMPVLVKKSRFSRDPLIGKYQALNDPDRPLATMAPSEREEIYDRLCQAVEQQLGTGGAFPSL